MTRYRLARNSHPSHEAVLREAVIEVQPDGVVVMTVADEQLFAFRTLADFLSTYGLDECDLERLPSVE